MKRLLNDKPGERDSFSSSEKLIEYAREYYSSDFQNSEREGCPDPEVIIALLDSGRLPGETLRSHLFSCSECFLCYREAQLKLESLSDAKPASWWNAISPSLWQKPTLVAASLFLAALVALNLLVITWQTKPQAPGVAEHSSEPQAGGEVAAGADDATPGAGQNGADVQASSAQPPKNSRRATGRGLRAAQKEVYVRIDLRTGVLRGPVAPAPQESKPKELSPSRISFLFTLPEGSLKGTYQVSIVDAFGKQLVSGKGVSSNGKTLKISLDLSELPEQRYRLCVSRAREIPDCYQVAVIGKK